MKREDLICLERTVQTDEKGPVRVVLRKGPHGGVLARADLSDAGLGRWTWNDLTHHKQSPNMDEYAQNHIRELGLTPKTSVTAEASESAQDVKKDSE